MCVVRVCTVFDVCVFGVFVNCVGGSGLSACGGARCGIGFFRTRLIAFDDPIPDFVWSVCFDFS